MSDKILLYNEPPRLVTERLILVHPNSKYAADLYEYGSRQDFVSSIGIPPQKSIDAAVEFIKFLSKENETHKRMYWVLVDKKSGVAIGTLGFIFTYAIHHRVAEFGYGINPDYWGTGVFQEASRAILNFGFNDLDIFRIQSLARADNFRAIKGVEKLGFTREATLKDFYQLPGRRVDAAVMFLIPSATICESEA